MRRIAATASSITAAVPVGAGPGQPIVDQAGPDVGQPLAGVLPARLLGQDGDIALGRFLQPSLVFELLAFPVALLDADAAGQSGEEEKGDDRDERTGFGIRDHKGFVGERGGRVKP